ncbi:MAG TPA: hydroxymethylbilane synthase [Actinobacteria bacterium]|nr:hydroxymethylbilane synthase [Actinomycetota bacterium]
MKKIVIGTRGSRLALWQANFVAEQLKKIVSCEIVIKKIKTTGDKILDFPLTRIEGKGLFVKEIETALLNGEVDLAVHSMKDVPTDLPEGLVIGAMMPREDPLDALVSRDGFTLEGLPNGAVIGTSSLRRRAQLLHFRSDFTVTDVRGNLDTRLKKLESGKFDAIVVAAAGLIRMGWSDRITVRISTDVCLPAVGQGAVGVEIRGEDEEMAEPASVINHAETFASISAERALLKRLEGGCQIPIGALGIVEEGELKITAAVANLDGSRLVRHSISGSPGRAEEVGIALAERLLELGANEILSEIRAMSIEPRILRGA